MSIALQGSSPFGTALIEPEMLPSPELLAEMNRIVRAWASQRKNTYVVPLASFFERMLSDEDVILRGNRWKGNARDQILQADLLHPTLAGDISLTILTLDTLAQNHPEFCQPCIHWSEGEIRERILARIATEREKNLEKQRKRRERRKKPEEDKQHVLDPPTR